MERNYFDQTEVEQTIGEAVKKMGISKNVFIGSRPKSVTEGMSDFVVVKMYGSINDLYAYGRTVSSIHLFARDVQTQKNGKKLSLMQHKLYSQLSNGIGKLILGDATVMADTSDGVGFHARIINFSTTIKAI